jgi:TPR repeat protein
VVAATAKIPSASPALSADILTLLLNRGDALLALGDVSSARLLYQRAAAGGDGRAATGMGKTYDPLFLSAIGARGIQADSGTAATWYRKAIGLGDESAAERLKRLSQVSVR